MPDPGSTPAATLYLVDGYALIYRAFFAMIARPLTTRRGENTSAAWGVTNFLLTCFRSEEHTSELQSHSDLVCRLLLEKKKIEIREQGRRLNLNHRREDVNTHNTRRKR